MKANKSEMYGHRKRRLRRLGAGGIGATAVALVAIAMSSTGGFVANAAVQATTATAKCGTVPKRPLPASTGGLLAKLPVSVRSMYNGFGTPVQKSVWANWKPSSKTGLTIGVSFNALINPFNAAVYNDVVSELKATPGVANVIAYTAASAQDVSGQLQQFQSLIQQHVDLIVTLAASGPAFIPAIQQAAAAGIPTVSLVNDIESPDSVNISPNTWQDVAAPVTSILNGIGKKGNVLEVHGIPGTQTDTDTFTDFGDLLAPCPGISVLGAVDGDYSPPAVESAVLQFLSTNPAPVAAVLQTATMAPYVMEAFQKAGRPIPPVVDVGAQEGSLAYWSENRKTYHGGATVGGDLALANEAVRVVRRMLVGQGVKVNNIIWYQPVVTTANLSKFVQPSWALTTQGTVEDPPSTYVTNAELNALFNHPKIKVTAP